MLLKKWDSLGNCNDTCHSGGTFEQKALVKLAFETRHNSHVSATFRLTKLSPAALLGSHPSEQATQIQFTEQVEPPMQPLPSPSRSFPCLPIARFSWNMRDAIPLHSRLGASVLPPMKHDSTWTRYRFRNRGSAP